MTTEVATTTYSPRVTRDGDDFLAEVAVWSDSPVPEYIFVGYFERHSDAYAAACEESTDCAKRAAADAAIAAQPMTVEVDATAQNRADALEFEPFDDCEIETCCESCGEPLDFEDAVEIDGEMWCEHCADEAPTAAGRFFASGGEAGAGFEDCRNDGEPGAWVHWTDDTQSAARREWREALTQQGAIEDAASDAAQVQAA
jgi:hypothetical protein